MASAVLRIWACRAGRKLQLLVGGQPACVTDIVEGGECRFTTSGKRLDPAFEGFGMDMQALADGLGILAAVQEQNRVQALGDAVIIGLFEASPHILRLGAAEGK